MRGDNPCLQRLVGSNGITGQKLKMDWSGFKATTPPWNVVWNAKLTA